MTWLTTYTVLLIIVINLTVCHEKAVCSAACSGSCHNNLTSQNYCNIPSSKSANGRERTCNYVFEISNQAEFTASIKFGDQFCASFGSESVKSMK